MEQLIKKESQRILQKQTNQARIERQKQVRQQAMAWTQQTRRKFEDSKEREIKNLSEALTDQARATAIENIQLLTKINDLAMSEIGMAHRAAAGFQNVERIKSLKRLKNEELAKNRGSSALTKQLKENQAKSAKKVEIIKRKESVRRAEDRKSREIISQRPPLSATNSNLPSKSPSKELGPPHFYPSLAKTLKTMHGSESDKVIKAKKKVSSSSEAKVRVEQKRPSRSKTRPESSGHEVKGEEVQPGVLPEMVRVRVSDSRQHGDEISKAVPTGLNFRDKYKKYLDSKSDERLSKKPSPVPVRYFDATVPKAEVKYIPPDGLAVKELPKGPDAWEKGREFSEKVKMSQEDKIQQHEEKVEKARRRGKRAMKQAKLEKEMNEVRNELLQEIALDHDVHAMGSGQQKAILGLDKNEPGSRLNSNSDEFSEVDSSDEEFSFPNPKLGTETVGGGGGTSGKPLLSAISSDEFSAVGSDEENSFPKVDVPRKEGKESQISDRKVDAPSRKGKDNQLSEGVGDTSNKSPKDSKTKTSKKITPSSVPTSASSKNKTNESQSRAPGGAPKAFSKTKEAETSLRKLLDLKMDSSHSKDKSLQHDDTATLTETGTGSASSSTADTSSGSSILIQVKVQEITATSDSTSTPSQTPSQFQINSTSTTQDSSSGSGRSRSRSQSYSTDYYSPPEGPFTSTPDGKLQLLQKQKADSSRTPRGHDMGSLKSRTLKYYFDMLTSRKPESIEQLPVTTSSSSVIQADSDILSMTELTEEHSSNGQNHSTETD